ncbi:bis(5'-nucleosyl)-tetraphosphatase (symmetrical) YqeK [Aphanothece sacrum]|uniref:bis(5'-nucleosyl)-tetraphosphatase (symmetrical) n=1 Tax=Aphanothece sacrum FPU1 TaxID=1920663 RepID=A0A401IK81_APHSA|nr:bis(5'-nucleosyl)-tetraphosphatase (symmetrical) YqeK [Aphanothece sacrum]GBF81703.1 metal dependent phosphohydrolase [Aphanothece sacrum FPU1]GBF85061.1 metal dependent phosphohydrolase [Aphanothece sacrum FPU3]
MREQVIIWLEQNVSQHRLQHILGVEQMCIDLANCHQVNPEKAAQAGLMHDLAKFFPPAQLLEMAKQEQSGIDPVCIANPHLLHAYVSAIVARDRFGIEDPEILSAISNHTLGSPQMSDLCCIVFVADALEPNRGNTPELETMRRVSRQNLYQSVQQTCEYSLKYLLKTQKMIHPQVILTRNWALSVAKQSEPNTD